MDSSSLPADRQWIRFVLKSSPWKVPWSVKYARIYIIIVNFSRAMRYQSSHKERQNKVNRLHVIVSLVVVALVSFYLF